MKRTKPPFRADHVGSYLRSAAITEARAKRDKGQISAADLKKVEDQKPPARKLACFAPLQGGVRGANRKQKQIGKRQTTPWGAQDGEPGDAVAKVQKSARSSLEGLINTTPGALDE